MVIYLDLIILGDFIVNLLCLIFIQKIVDERICLVRNIIVSLMGALLIIVAIYQKIVLEIMKIALGGIISYFGIKTMDKTKKVIEISLFYGLNLALVGFLFTWRITKWFLFVFGLILIFITFIWINFKKYYLTLLENNYSIVIMCKKKKQRIKLFIDTGSKVFFQGYPVVFINKKYYDNQELPLKVPIKTMIGFDYLSGYLENNLQLYQNTTIFYKKVIICYGDFEHDGLTGTDLFI